MSLFRQLWLAVILVTLTSFIGSFAVSMLSTRSYLEQQLHRKNIDSANSLALSISQLSKDPVTIGLQIAALLRRRSDGKSARIVLRTTATPPSLPLPLPVMMSSSPARSTCFARTQFSVRVRASSALGSDSRRLRVLAGPNRISSNAF